MLDKKERLSNIWKITQHQNLLEKQIKEILFSKKEILLQNLQLTEQ